MVVYMVQLEDDGGAVSGTEAANFDVRLLRSRFATVPQALMVISRRRTAE
ncbi:MAG: hypothetical protein OXD37_01665 [Acidimicrobiaceae bacterium]|nr:hypothetical protein [Acidimicrobiaceae bacterium]